VSCPRPTELETKVDRFTLVLRCTFDPVYGLAIYEDNRTLSKEAILHAHPSLLQESKGVLGIKTPMEPSKLSAGVLGPTLPWFKHANRATSGAIATIYHASNDGYISDPCTTGASLDLVGKKMPLALQNDHPGPQFMVSSIDIIVATAADPLLQFRVTMACASLPNCDARVKLCHAFDHSTKTTFEGLYMKAVTHSPYVATDKANEHLYFIEWQTNVPGGMEFSLCTNLTLDDIVVLLCITYLKAMFV